MIASPEHGCLGGAAVLARNGGIGAEPPGALPLGLSQAEPLTAGGLAARSAAVHGCGAVPATSPDPRTPRALRLSMLAVRTSRSRTGTPPDVPRAVPETAGTIYDMWGPHAYSDERSFYACSPHRIDMAAHLIRESFLADHANPALRLLPEGPSGASNEPDWTVTLPPGPARRPAPRPQRSFTTSMTSLPPRTTRRHSAAASEPGEAGGGSPGRGRSAAAASGRPAVRASSSGPASPCRRLWATRRTWSNTRCWAYQ